MAASIFHRATGFVLATAGMLVLIWWLYAIASGPDAYATFQTYVIYGGEQSTRWQIASNWVFRLICVAVVWSFFQHFFSGLRHLMMDMGAGYELHASRNAALMVFIASTTATGIVAMLVASRYLGV
jgi:succinate dehydrogenase / fumarate reductase, cytochrome b subunit